MASQFSTTASGGHRLGGGWGQTGREQGVRRSERRRAEREEQEVQGKIIRPGLAGIPLCSFLQDFWPAIVCVWMCVFPAGLFYAASVGDLGWLQGLAWGGYTSEPPNHITKACERAHTHKSEHTDLWPRNGDGVFMCACVQESKEGGYSNANKAVLTKARAVRPSSTWPNTHTQNVPYNSNSDATNFYKLTQLK